MNVDNNKSVDEIISAEVEKYKVDSYFLMMLI
jgi:hypothetical protein